MKNIKLLFAILLIVTLTSCSITEKLLINENGTGKFAYEIDGSKMISMMGSAFKDDEKETKKKKKKNKDNEITRDSKDIDSTFTFKEIFASKKDSIAKLTPEEQEKIKRMEKFSVHMVMNEEKGIMNYSMFTDFNTIQELQNVMSPLESMQTLSPKGQTGGFAMAPTGVEEKSATQFFYDGKTFKKSVAKTEKKKEEIKSDEISEEEAAAEKMKQSMEMIYDQSNFKVVYQFPKAVKKVSIENALYSDDRKTITIEYPLKEYMESPEKLNFEVTFE
ncbi:hypothetical protein [Flavobacterium sp.]|uniref:hypothetical protein n=1 Tax=Flavobacterium sp. TaxID=239 RepID=UPI0037504C6A